ncbi:MAG TPA: ribosome silencing factor [Eubacteriaceae bacterium]|nr:ribosome silencing factor [Eubacteriaceae bacterium]
MEMAEQIKDWIEEKNGKEVEVIDVEGLTPVTDVFVVASGSSTTNVKAIGEFVEEKAASNGWKLLGYEGRQNGRWVLLDYNNVVVHIFLEEEREFYNLERLWEDGKSVE